MEVSSTGAKQQRGKGAGAKSPALTKGAVSWKCGGKPPLKKRCQGTALQRSYVLTVVVAGVQHVPSARVRAHSGQCTWTCPCTRLCSGQPGWQPRFTQRCVRSSLKSSVRPLGL